MKLIVLSDTHIKKGQSLLALLPQDLISIIKSSDIIIHVGDFETLECYKELEALGKIAAVCGDTDREEVKKLLPERIVLKIEEINIGIIHKGQLTSENTDGLRYLAKEMNVDILIFGHFHHPIAHKGEVLLLSPGSATVPGIAEPSAIELEVTGRKVGVNIIRCKDHACTYFEYTM